MNIFKRTSALNMLLLLALQLMAQGPNGTGTYYQSADGKKGSALKTAMSKIIVDHETLNYGKLWDAYYDTDRREDGSVWDMYSSTTHFKFGQTNAAITVMKATATTANIPCRRAGLTMPHQCIQT